jgi:DNA-directed RNA polymerase specialized sigma24 family protein
VRTLYGDDERAFRFVFETHESAVRRLIYRLIHNKDDAEEVSAQALLRFWETSGRFLGSARCGPISPRSP